MIIGIVLFAFYLLAVGWLLWRLPFFANSGIPLSWRWALLALKAGAAAAYGWLFTYLPDYQATADTWRFHYAALTETEWLLSDPLAWLADLYTPRYAHDGGLLATQNSFANDLKDLLFLKFLSLLNLLSGGRYYLNCLLFSFLTFFGIVALARCWQPVLRLASPLYPLLAIMLWPSVLFWTSGLHRDGLLLHATGIAGWMGWRLVQHRGRLAGAWCWLLLHVAVLAMVRAYVLPMAVMGLSTAIGWWKLPPNRRWWLAAGVAVMLLAMALLPLLVSKQSLAMIIWHRQQAFEVLAARSELVPLALNGTWASIAHQFPTALSRALAMPPLNVPFRLTDIPFAFENLLLLALLWPALRAQRRLDNLALTAWVLGSSIAVLLIWLLSAYTVPVGMAVVRYKSIWWPFITPWLLWPLVPRLLPAHWLRQTTPKR